MLTEEKPPVMERADLILGKTIERKQVLKQKMEVHIKLNLFDTSNYPVTM